ncbi:MAG TPA: cytochrome c oxidase subunit II [Streptosporangiaceae bacterium]|jgi:cytochrome c oxidase subunit 2|nr:cytochrome c oxidase subunit II [Streptosporangiaceae bacterium]
MAASVAEDAPVQGAAGPNHGLRIFIIWLPLAVAADIVLYFVYGPHMPPGRMSTSAASQQFDIKVMSVLAAPVMIFVLVFMAYSVIVWRHREGDDEDGPPIYGHARIQATWITVTAVIVLFLAGFGTYELAWPGFAGAGAGQGPSPIWKPNGTPLQVQVIAQQWRFTYRYPQFGGFETTQLMLPVNEPIQFNVTSLDVIHSFWAYQLGVKADANPGVNNVAYTTAIQTGNVTVRCAELCGLWHGAMFDYGRVVSVAAFKAWAARTEVKLAAVTRILPPYASTYDPTVVPQINKAMAKAGIGGANGYYYPPNDPVQP